jgi:hypothetical protein
MEDRFEAACRWAASRHTRVSSLGVCRSTAEGRYVAAECATLDEARRISRQTGPDRYGRNPVIVALTPEGWAIELEIVEFG